MSWAGKSRTPLSRGTSRGVSLASSNETGSWARPSLNNMLPIELSIKLLTGEVLELNDMTETNTLLDVKKQIYAREGIPVGQQRIIYDGRTLKGNKRPLWEYNIIPRSQLHLVVTPKDQLRCFSGRVCSITILLSLWITMELCAIVVCVYKYKYNCNDMILKGYATAPSTALIIGSIVTLIYMIYKISVICCVVELRDNVITQIIDRIFYVSLFAWTIVGFIVYHQMDSVCRLQPLGKMLVAWSVIHFIVSICGGAFILYIEP
eukprot:1072907_1